MNGGGRGAAAAHDSEQDSDEDAGANNGDDNDIGNDEDSKQQPKANGGAALSRHGFDSSEETLRELESRYFLYYTDVSWRCNDRTHASSQNLQIY